ncbi:MAG: FliG C-terminal domain-containing protein [Elusimicrobiales bacterium]|nr:FliG C-terminal domain-containing protein [Elusimicrobiales bacterium]
MNIVNLSAKLLRGALVAAALPVLFASAARAQNYIPLDEQAKFEKMLETKSEEALAQMLGPGQAKLAISASLDFDKTEKMVLNTTGEERKPVSQFLYDEGQESGPQSELLPGIPAPAGMNYSPKATEHRYQRELIFPSSFVKQLRVNLIINETVPAEAAGKAKAVVSSLLGVDDKRGDTITVIRTRFTPPWRAMLEKPESLNFLFKYAVLALLGLLTLLIVGVSFFKMASAMNELTKAQYHQIQMEMPKGDSAPSDVERIAILSDRRGGGAPEQAGGAARPAPEESGGGEGRILFNVKPDQVDSLLHLLGKENPVDIALVVAYLPDEVKKKFLAGLAPHVYSDVLLNMGKVRYVEPGVVDTLKDELERRLASMVGGVKHALEIVEQSSLREQKALLDNMSARDPEFAKVIRSRVLLPEDMARLDDRELAQLAALLRCEVWADALASLDDALRERLQAVMPLKTWQMVEETAKYVTPTQDRADAAQAQIVDAAKKLIADGKISNPLFVCAPQSPLAADNAALALESAPDATERA